MPNRLTREDGHDKPLQVSSYATNVREVFKILRRSLEPIDFPWPGNGDRVHSLRRGPTDLDEGVRGVSVDKISKLALLFYYFIQ